MARCVAAVGASVAPRVASRARARRREWFDCVRARASAVVTYSSLACVVKRRMRFAVDRLKVLRTIDALRQKGFKPKELEAELAPVVRELLPLAAAGPQAQPDARKE